jgi:hypothetical protein
VPRLVARLVVDYFDYAARPNASARRAAHRAARHRLLHLAQARRRLLRLRRASDCFGMSRGSSRGSLSTTSPTRARPGASAHRVARHVARCRLLRIAQARRRLLRLCRVSGCHGTSRGSSSGSSSTTSPTPRVWLLQLVARLVV